jgi:hypothetical protein
MDPRFRTAAIRMTWKGMWHNGRDKKNKTKFWSENPKEREYFEDLGTDR